MMRAEVDEFGLPAGSAGVSLTRRRGPELAGVLTGAQLRASADSIAASQTRDGLILWTPGGHADPWNHVETAMALDVAGRHAEAERAYDWMVAHQREDGAWHQYYVADGVEDPKFDANTIAYVATGAWHHYLSTGDGGFLAAMWPVVERAVDWVLELQQPTGEILWARQPDGTPFDYALLTGSSSMAHSLESAVSVAGALGKERPDWDLAAELLREAIACRPERFARKDRWAMDWYYPVLAGVVAGERAEARLREHWDRFVMHGDGVRCVDDEPWVTTGETAECAIALARAGMTDAAVELLRWIAPLRYDDGSYWTGLHVPSGENFPGGERTAYSAAAMILAVDALAGTTPAAAVFRPRPAPAA